MFLTQPQRNFLSAPHFFFFFDKYIRESIFLDCVYFSSSVFSKCIKESLCFVPSCKAMCFLPFNLVDKYIRGSIFLDCVFSSSSNREIVFLMCDCDRTTFLRWTFSQPAILLTILGKWFLGVLVSVKLLFTLFLLERFVSVFYQHQTWQISLFVVQIITPNELQGSTAVALYGLGNIRDERLNRMFQVLYTAHFHSIFWLVTSSMLR